MTPVFYPGGATTGNRQGGGQQAKNYKKFPELSYHYNLQLSLEESRPTHASEGGVFKTSYFEDLKKLDSISRS